MSASGVTPAVVDESGTGPVCEANCQNEALQICTERSEDVSKGSNLEAASDAQKQAALCEAEKLLPPRRIALVVMICVVQGYTLIGPLQHSFKVAMQINDTGRLGHAFTQAAALVQWGKFAMTLGQNVVLWPFSPMTRVYIAVVAIMVGSIIPPLFVYTLKSHWLGWVFLSFGLIGLGLGVFECTFLSVITPLGPLTKSWAIMGFPGAFFIINVFAALLISFGLPEEAVFWYIVACMPVGIVLFATQLAPGVRGEGERSSSTVDTKSSTASVWSSVMDWRCWLPKLAPFILMNIVGHFVMEGALPANYNTFNDKVVPMLSRTDSDHLMNTKRFFVVFFVFVGAGDILSRRVGYCFSLKSYSANLIALAIALLCSVLGMYLTTLGVGVIAWLSAFLTFWGQGFHYAVASKYIDRFVPRQHTYAAYSFWMFAGSAGAIAGSTMVDVIRQWICNDETYPHACLSHH